LKVVTTPPAAALIRERGGRLYVWAKAAQCCGGTRFVAASTEPPRDLERFRRIQSDPLELYVRPAGDHGLPNELEVDLARLRRNRPQAQWDGCPYLP
jgi:hypothetical protein